MTPDASLEQELRDVFQRHEHLAEALDDPRPADPRSRGPKSRASKARPSKSGGGPPRAGGARPSKGRKKRRDPGWARLLVVLGALMMVGAGSVFVAKDVVFGYATRSVKQETLLPVEPGQGKRHVSIKGAKNILLIGIDPRENQNPNDLIRADSILILHVPATHDAGYLISIPRDTWVRIPAYNNGGKNYAGGHDKINGAFAWGGDGLTDPKAKRKHGTTLLARTITSTWGVSFDAAAIVDFQGFQDVVKVLGGVDMYVDQRTISVHVGTDSKGNPKIPYRQRDNGRGGTDLIEVPGVKPKIYEVGYQHLEPWEALDYVRQRETLPNSDYDRQRHQQQFIKALFKKIASKDVLTDVGKLTGVLEVVGKAMTIDNGGISLDDWVFAMKGVSPDNILTLKTNNGSFHSSAENPGAEALDATTLALLEALKQGKIQEFVANNAGIVSQA